MERDESDLEYYMREKGHIMEQLNPEFMRRIVNRKTLMEEYNEGKATDEAIIAAGGVTQEEVGVMAYFILEKNDI